MSVPACEGTSAIAALPVFSLVYHSDHAIIRGDLTARGKLWEDHRGYHYKQYKGIAETDFCSREVKLNIKSRIIIDTKAYNTLNPNDEIYLDSDTSDELSDDQRLISTPINRGYVLKDKYGWGSTLTACKTSNEMPGRLTLWCCLMHNKISSS